MPQQAKILNQNLIIESARQVIDLEAQALNHLSSLLGNGGSAAFLEAVQLILETKGRVVVTGMGKSGHIANKIAATLASTGTPSFFIHPSELLHGDFGMIVEEDIVMAISNSGETQEVTNTLAFIKRRGLKLIGITSGSSSTLAKHSDIILSLGVTEEACPLGLAPTTSTTATLALGDALAVVLMKEKNFTREDFAGFHPGGALGKSLLKVSELMRTLENEIPKVYENTKYKEILTEINNKKLGFTCVVNQSSEALAGTITDGDLRRAQIHFAFNTLEEKLASELMNKSPKTISSESLAQEALKLMEDHRISALIILSESGKPIGVLDLKDLLRAGIY
ncbi:MAG: SIS domain-containing protein [Candidatus Melainabacteria bacterium]